MSRHLIITALLLFLGLLSTSAVLADPVTPEWEDKASPLALNGFTTSSNIAPVWMDADMDGVMEVVYIGFNASRVLDISEDDGSYGSYKMDIQGGGPLEGVGLPAPVLSLLDVDRDDTPELLIIGKEVRIFRLTAPYELTDMEMPLPMMPGTGLWDAATGDLNNDGLNDIVIALGVIANEKLERIGYPDMILMNLGHGRFEQSFIEPSRPDFSNGISLADVDGDRRLDIVESINYSPVVGPSRILLNRTPAGATVPVFEPHISSLTVGGESTSIVPGHDTGTHGMGACIADVNGDGFIDIYNTSTGIDQLSLGRADGGFDDATFTHRILHAYGADGLRIQWSPTFIDMNMDSLLDIYVRHGGLGMTMPGMMGPGVTDLAADPVYVQGEDGMFYRSNMYADPDYSQGRNAVFGDLDRDGSPDVAQGGAQGASGYHRNATPVADTTRLLTVGFRSTVSPTPAYGARVIATCGGESLVRVTTSGGKMGGVEAHEVYFAWPECSEDPEMVVQWPSGATATVSDITGPYIMAQEPEWWIVPDIAVKEVEVYPEEAGAEEICVGTHHEAPEEEGSAPEASDSEETPENTGTWNCCSALEGTCTLEVPEIGDARATIRVDDHPAMALPWRPERWTIVTEPQPPSPGDPVTLSLLHTGTPGVFKEMVKPTLFVGGEYLGWTTIDNENSILTAHMTVPEGAPNLEVSLFPGAFPDPDFVVQTGYAMDPILSKVDAYPYRILGGVTELWTLTIFITGIRDHKPDDIVPHVKLYRPDGTEIPSTGNVDGMSTARLRVMAGLEDLEGLSQVILKDGASGIEVPIDLPPPLTMEEAAAVIHHAEGGPMWNRLVENGDHTGFFFGLYDEQDRLLPPEPDLVYVEAEGAEFLGPLDLAFGRYQLFTVMETLPGTTEGAVRVYASNDGRLLGTFPFRRRSVGGWSPEPEMSSASIVEVNDLWGSGVTHDVVVRVANQFDEVLGPNATVEVEVVQFGQLLEMHLIGNGNWVASVQANTGKGVLEADVYIEGNYFETVSIDTNIPIPPGPPVDDPGPEEEPDPVEEPGPEKGANPDEEPAAPASEGGGCGGAGGLPSGILSLMAMLLWGWGVRRQRWDL